MRRGLLPAVAAAVVASAIAVPEAPAAPQLRSLVVYAKPTRVQFVSHSDDRARGDIKNPFQADVLPTPPDANTGKKGARAGDNALFSFKLFADPGLKRPIGSAIYHCTVNFAQEAVCNADFELAGGTMIASGPAKLNTSAWVLPVSGGTGRYAGARGQMTSAPAGAKTKTLTVRFELL